jgi:tetratricopeptide (TPR) repeat protein
MNSKDFSYFIERYISNEMTESERQWFLLEMEGNHQLRNEVELRRKTDELLRRQSTLSLRTKLSSIENARKERIKSRLIMRMKIVKYAAVFAGAVVITTMILFSGRNLTNEEIANQFYKTYAAPTGQRSLTAAANKDYVLGLKYYNDQDYKNAATQFAKVLKTNPNDMQSHLLSGVSNMEEKRYSEAKQSFTTVIDNNNNLFIESAQWYLALCYVKTQETDKASKLLMEIKNGGGFYSKDARKVLRKLN